MKRSITRLLLISAALTVLTPFSNAQTPIQVFGTWHCGNDYCTWGTVRDMVEFDQENNWIIDRGDGVPSVNLVVLAFVNPLKLLHETTDSQPLNGVHFSTPA